MNVNGSAIVCRALRATGRLFHRIRAEGASNVPERGGALLVSNHQSIADPALLQAVLRRRVHFMMGREAYARRPFQFLFRAMETIPISPRDPPRLVVQALRRARDLLDRGEIVCIFAEGAMTRNGNLRDFRPGMERIVRGSAHPIIPVHIGGAWGSAFSHCYGALLARRPGRRRRAVSVVFGLPMPPDSPRAQVRARIQELSTRDFDLRAAPDAHLGAAFVRGARARWRAPALGDSEGRCLSGGRALAAAVALGRLIARVAGEAAMVGVIMPPSVGAALANLGTYLAGRIPVNLNFTAPAEAVDAAIRRCGIRTVISSRRFLEKYGRLQAPPGTVFIEDLIAQLGARQKLGALLRARFLPARRLIAGPAPGPGDTATVIFSSGSTGEPKGAVLTHRNILSNVAAVLSVYRFGADDRMCAVLPLFHSFGFTCNLWVPLLGGFPAFFHPSPLDASGIAALVRRERLTVLLATPTFLLAYMRRATRDDFASLRTVIAGAEKLRPAVAGAFARQFGVRPLEGYGATELSPVVSLNVPDVEVAGVAQTGTREGSVGHPLPGVAVRVVDPETGGALPEGAAGMLLVKGPNVMRGYLGDPETTAQVLREGWYETGDIASLDGDGFIHILDRVSRYSKIGGEMVPHLAVEETLASGLKTMDRVVAVTSAADERKGEQLVVFYTAEAGDADALAGIAAQSPLPNLWRPRRDNYVRVEALPLLGSGKLDLKRLRRMAEDFVARPD